MQVAMMEVTAKFSKSPLTSPDNIPQSERKNFLSPKMKFDLKHGIFQKPSLHGMKPSHRKSTDRYKVHQPLKMLFNNDPLNLVALCNNSGGRESPETSSPVLDRSHEFEPSNVQPFDFKDPLNLNQDDDACILQKPPRKRKRRKRRNTFASPDKESVKDNIMSDLNSTFNESDVLTSPNEVKNTDSRQHKKLQNNSFCHIEHNLPLKHKIKSRHSQSERLKSNVSSLSPLDVTSLQKFNKKNEKYKYGNYFDYYNTNNKYEGNDMRLSCFKKEWFENKACLDIGCNTGKVTCLIAKHFSPQSILGVDIDSGLIKIAKKCIVQASNTFHKCDRKFPLSLEQMYGPIVYSKNLNNPEVSNIKFVAENYVPSSKNVLNYVKAKYDTILCLNITKWVQLNFGDEGLKLMFKKIFLQLVPGGRLILEPQSFQSYKKKKNLTMETRKNFDEMQLLPNDYVAYLLSNEIGFAQSERLSHSGKRKIGYDHPIYLLTKSGLSTEQNTNAL